MKKTLILLLGFSLSGCAVSTYSYVPHSPTYYYKQPVYVPPPVVYHYYTPRHYYNYPRHYPYRYYR